MATGSLPNIYLQDMPRGAGGYKTPLELLQHDGKAARRTRSKEHNLEKLSWTPSVGLEFENDKGLRKATRNRL
ncbi:hypothetical protein BGX21_006007 [Mortierella sp. AD011]|nr:hypothetical protein BGX21_006007 [Mortierella sp. AD011]